MDILLEALVKLEVEREFAVLAPVGGLGAGASLDDVLGEGNLHESLCGVDLDVGGAGRAARAQERDADNPNLLWDDSGHAEAWRRGGQRNEGEERNGLHSEI